MTLREWTDPRDGRHWTVWLERGDKPWRDYQGWYDGRLEGEFIVARTDTGTVLNPMGEGPVRLRLQETVEVDGHRSSHVCKSGTGVQE